MKNQSDLKTGSRLSYLDNLRINLTVLVILHHSSVVFDGGDGCRCPRSNRCVD